jgi:hypothetical protein
MPRKIALVFIEETASCFVSTIQRVVHTSAPGAVPPAEDGELLNLLLPVSP